jgi:AcrR family transcriptional regulator
MGRPKRDPEFMRSEILDAAEQLLLDAGPKSLTLRKIAERVGVSHPALLYYFDGLGDLLEALRQRSARTLRTALLNQLDSVGAQTQRDASLQQALAELSSPKQGVLLAWLIAEGKLPFPPAEERGLKAVVDRLAEVTEHDRAALEDVVELVVLASIGDALVGGAVRDRLDRAGDEGAFSERLMRLVQGYLDQASDGD